ncbi:hypothetical protein [Cerasicoccus maritimus]|uniref:hypothetical protein n=1 Tax=Cerasicoccus maritimus TaxID=490089 RepID=UPI002852A22C|nr:hypothetical protein [Cerasicoccus maritimus]
MSYPLFWIAPVSALVALFFAWRFYAGMMRQHAGNERMVEIATHVSDGARAFHDYGWSDGGVSNTVINADIFPTPIQGHFAIYGPEIIFSKTSFFALSNWQEFK